VIQASAFAEAVREFAHLQSLPALPDGISFAAEEEREQQTHLERARQRTVALFNELTAATTPQAAAEFERRQAQLEGSLEALAAATGLPAEWQQQLSDLAEANNGAYEDWQVEQRKEEEARRLAQENERRQANNRKLVDGALKQAKSAQSLREIQNAVASLNAARAALEPPCDEQVEQIERALHDLCEREETIRGWGNEVLPERLESAWTVSEVQELRKNIVSYETRCVGDETLAGTLNQARLRLDERIAFLNELGSLEMLRQFRIVTRSWCNWKLCTKDIRTAKC
jgi:chromosome segregation ATPase